MHRGAGKNEQRVAGGKIKNRGKIRQIACPVCPSGHESGKIAKGVFAPNVQTAFVGITRRKLDHGEGERRVEDEPGTDPNCYRTRASGGGGGNPAQADAGNHVEKHQVPEGEYTPGPLGIGRLGNRNTRPGEVQIMRIARWFLHWVNSWLRLGYFFTAPATLS